MGKAPWNNYSDDQKVSTVDSTLEAAFLQGKTGTLPAGLRIQDSWWRMLSPSITSGGWDSFMNANQWIYNRIKGKEEKYGIPFTYSKPASNLVKPTNPNNNTYGDEITPGITPANAIGDTINWPLILGAVLLAGAGIFALYKFKNK